MNYMTNSLRLHFPDHDLRIYSVFRPVGFLFLALMLHGRLTANEVGPNEKSKPDERRINKEIIEPNIDGNKLARLFEKFTGQKVSVTPEAAATRFSFVQAASDENPISFREAGKMVRKSAIIENFVFSSDEKDPETLILKPVSNGTHGCKLRMEIYNSSTPLPNNDSVITYVMELKHIASKEALAFLESKRDKSEEYYSIAAVPRASAIVITEKVSNVRKYIAAQTEFDRAGPLPKQEPEKRN
jgi:hypothetical protein